MIELFDLHGLYVREAVQFVESVFEYHKSNNRMILRFIIGKGNHSVGMYIYGFIYVDIYIYM
jgi:DNA-nicking Smr family endonuclease